ncbi:MAG: hypothetical protein DRO13_05225 [Thermoprotei archaeon]|nr:MAG: hypothetical protein DRO13_05225 [Thermoprotei archaeon]
MNLDYNRLSVKYEAVIEFDGIPVIDSKLASLLRLIQSKGSILAAAKSLNIPYSRAWEMITRTERILKVELVKTQRGRGSKGAILTSYAEELLELYDKAERKLLKTAGSPRTAKFFSLEEPDLVVAYSHDPLLELVLGRLRERKYKVEGLCIGSGMALATLSLGEADIACIHLYDPGSKSYNDPYVGKLWLRNRVSVLNGYYRELVFALRPGVNARNVEEVVFKILRGELRIVNRNIGSGTRVYFDYLLNRIAKQYGLSLDNIKGYANEVYTHIEAARQVALGKADVALLLKYAALLYGLKNIHVTWELYQCIALNKSLEKRSVREFAKITSSKWFRTKLSKIPGYRAINRMQ